MHLFKFFSFKISKIVLNFLCLIFVSPEVVVEVAGGVPMALDFSKKPSHTMES